MIPSFPLSGERHGFLALAMLGLVVTAFAQTPSGDSFETMRTNQGEAQRANIPRVFDQWTTISPGGAQYPYRPLLAYDGAVPVPPLPPALGDIVPEGPFTAAPVPQAVELAREPFYGTYVTLVATNRMSEKLGARVVRYRASRDALVRELTGKLDALRDVSPAERAAALAEFGQTHDARFLQLAQEAESIRSDLDGVDASYRFHGVYPGYLPGEGVTAAQALRLIKARYHYPALSDDQRQLLPEIAYNTVVWLRNPDPSEEDPRGSELYFWPATSRIRLPANLPTGLEAKVVTFAREKERLKSALRAAVLREENQWGFRRAQRLADFAAEQAPGFRALETLAEEIRVELASHTAPREPEVTTLPPDLTRRVGQFTARKAAVQRDLASQLRQMRAQYPHERLVVQRRPNSLAIVQGERGPELPGLAELNASFAARYEALGRDADAIRRDLEAYTRATPSVGGMNVERVAAQFAKAYRARETQTRYRDYQRAVLEPGLTPTQRALLFQAAVEELDRAEGLARP